MLLFLVIGDISNLLQNFENKEYKINFFTEKFCFQLLIFIVMKILRNLGIISIVKKVRGAYDPLLLASAEGWVALWTPSLLLTPVDDLVAL